MAETENKFNLNRFWTTRNKEGDSIGLSAYGRRVTLDLFKKDVSGNGPAVKFPLSYPVLKQIRDLTTLVMKATEPVKHSYTATKFNPQTKQVEKGDSVIISKNEKNLFFIEIQSDKIGSSVYQFTSPSAVIDGTPISAEQRSRLGIETFFHALTVTSDQAELLSTFNWSPKFGGANGSGGSRQSGSADPYAGPNNPAADEVW